MRRIVVLVVAVFAAGVALAAPAFGAMATNTFADTAEIGANGQRVRVRAFISCTTPGTVQVRATLTEDDAYGEGTSERVRCTGERQRIPILITAAEGTTFATGAATVCGLAINRVQGEVVDTRQWCREITLVNER